MPGRAMTYKIVPIKFCAEVLPGFSLKKAVAHNPEGTHQIILAKHLPQFGPYHFLDEHELRIILERPVQKYLLAEGDILFMPRGVNNYAVIVETVPPNTVAAGSFYILRAKDGLEPAYLAWVLNQTSVQTNIAAIRTGAGTPLVSRALLKEIRIVLPPIDEQRHIAKIGRLIEKEKQLLEMMNEEIDLKHRLVGQKITSMLEQRALRKDIYYG